MSKIDTNSGLHLIQNANKMESIASAEHRKVQFNKLWIYPASGIVAGKLSDNADANGVYVGERTTSGDVTPDLLLPDDGPILIELPQGQTKALQDILIQGATVGDGVWFKWWTP